MKPPPSTNPDKHLPVATSTSDDWRRRFTNLTAIFFPISLAILVTLMLRPTLHSYFIADDFAWLRFIRVNPPFMSAISQPSLGDFMTPVSNAFFWGLYQLFGLEPKGYYIAILLMHLLNCVLVYALALHVTECRAISAIGTFIFGMHFLHFSDWGALVWISAFVQVVVAFFYLGSLLAFQRFLRNGWTGHYMFSLLFFLIALASKETAVSLPIVVTVLFVLNTGRFSRARWLQAVRVLFPFFLFLAAYMIVKYVSQTSDRYFEVGLYGPGAHLLLNWKYFSNLVIPNPESPPIASFLSSRVSEWLLTASILVVNGIRAVLLVTAVFLWIRGPVAIRFWIAMSLISFLPFIGFSGGHAGAHRYFYLPLVGFVMIVAHCVWLLHRRLRVRKSPFPGNLIIVVGLLGFWAVSLLVARNWQARMNESSALARQVVKVLERELSEDGKRIEVIQLKGFRESEITNVERIALFLFGLRTEGADDPSVPRLLLTFDRGVVSAERPIAVD